MKRLLTQRPNDFRYCVSVGLAVGISQGIFRDASSHLGLVGGLLAAAVSGGVIALLIGLLWPAAKKGSPEAAAAK